MPIVKRATHFNNFPVLSLQEEKSGWENVVSSSYKIRKFISQSS